MNKRQKELLEKYLCVGGYYDENKKPTNDLEQVKFVRLMYVSENHYCTKRVPISEALEDAYDLEKYKALCQLAEACVRDEKEEERRRFIEVINNDN